MKIALTGAAGFLGWHTRCRLHANGGHNVVPITRQEWPDLKTLISDVDAVIHIAGVNRGDPDEVANGNQRLAEDLAQAVRAAQRPVSIVFANSIQAGNATAYGDGKQAAAEILSAACTETESGFVDVRLPNIFGEHSRPNYNSFVATFVDAVLAGRTSTVDDRPIELIHAQEAAQVLIDGLTGGNGISIAQSTCTTTVRGVLDRLIRFKELYTDHGDFPPLETPMDIDLLNQFRAAMFPQQYPIPLVQHSDQRGSFVETIRSHGGQGQTSFSTTKPGVTRGEHYHLRKIERFVVLDGTAQISLRRLFTDHVVSFDVSGREPVILDMPTMWVHNITNIGNRDLTTLFWSHELFDPVKPDTFRESVRSSNVEHPSHHTARHQMRTHGTP